MSRPDPRTTDRTLLVAMLLLLLYGILVVAWGFVRVQGRADQLADSELERALAVAAARVERTLSPVVNDLRHESVFIARTDSLDPTALVERWAPLLQGNYAYLALRLADEAGNEVAFCRTDTTWELMLTEEASIHGPPLRWSTRDPFLPLREWRLGLADTLADPRARGWFGKAVASTRTEPVWSHGCSGCPPPRDVLFASLRIRSSRREGAFHVLAIELATERLPVIVGAGRLENTLMALLDAEGRPVQPLAIDDPTDSLLMAEVVQQWKDMRASERFRTGEGAGTSYARARSWRANGLGWTLLAAVRGSDIRARFSTDRHVLFAGVALLVLLAGVAGWAYLRKRTDSRVRRMQELRSQSREEKLAKALGEREVLDREVHHRVKNNLQVVSSLLNLQAMRLAEGRVKDEFMRGKQRIDSMALVHHRLYALQDLRGIDLQRFFLELIDALVKGLDRSDGTVSHEVRTNAIKADADTAIQLGIILSELVINCHRHAFPHGSGGHVEVQLELVEDDLHRFVVRDNGVGLGDREGPTGDTRLGLEIVEALAEQLDGSLHVTSGTTGTAVEVLFRMKSA